MNAEYPMKAGDFCSNEDQYGLEYQCVFTANQEHCVSRKLTNMIMRNRMAYHSSHRIDLE